jgi:HSP20 family protein
MTSSTKPTQGTDTKELTRYTVSPLTVIRDMFDQLDLGVPRVDITHQGEQLEIEVDLPGISPDDLNITIDDYMLDIEGERINRREQREGNVALKERAHGRFHRVIPLPQHVDPETAEARFENGVLEIKVRAPKERQHPRRVPIKVTGEQPAPSTTH